MCAKTRRLKTTRRKKEPKGSLFNILLIFFLIALVAALVAYFIYEVEKPESKVSQNPATNTSKSAPTKKTAPAVTLNGTWVSTTDGRILDIKGERFSLELPSVSDHEIVKGKLQIKGQTVSFTYFSQKNNCTRHPGTYRFSRQKNTLRFRVIHDECTGRKQIFSTLWEKF